MNKIQSLNKGFKSALGLALILCLLLGLFPAVVSAEDGDTWNPEGQSYVISTAADLNAFRSSINKTNTYKGVIVTLAKDIEVGGIIWDSGSVQGGFEGIFNGQGYTINGFDDASSGLFYNLYGQIINLNMSFNVTANRSYGGLVNNMYDGAAILNCSVSGTFESNTSIAGMVAMNYGSVTIKNCYSSASITSTGGAACSIMASARTGASIENCYAIGMLNGSTSNYPIANIYSGAECSISDCYYLDSISATAVEGVNAKSESDLKNQAAYPSTWDFTVVWQMDATTGYPILRQTLAADQAVADPVTAKIEALPVASEITLDDEEAVAEVRSVYDALTETQKGYVSDSSLAVLEAAEAAINSLKAGSTFDPASNNYVISTAYDLNAFRSSISATNTYKGVTVTLGNDIDISTAPFQSWKTLASAAFEGVFDGKGYTIKGYNDGTNRALLYQVGETGQIINLNVEYNLASGSTMGGIAYYVDGTLNSCSVSGTINSKSHLGGLAYYVNATGTVKNCSCNANITAAGKEGAGIARRIYGTVENCYTTSTVSAKTIKGIGDLYESGIATNCFYIDTIAVTSSTNEAGLAKSETELQKQETYTGWDFENIWQIETDSFPTLRQTAAAADEKTEIQVKALVTITDKTVPATDINTDYSQFLKADYQISLVAADGTEASQAVIDSCNAQLVLKNPDSGIKNPLLFTGIEGDCDFTNALNGLLNQYELSYTADGTHTLNFFSDEDRIGVYGEDYSANKPKLIFNDNTSYSQDKKDAAIAATETRIQESLAYYLPADVSGHDAVFGAGNKQYGSWLIFTSARAGYTPHAGFFDECYQAFAEKYTASKKVTGEGQPLNEGFDANEVAKDALAITAMGYDARNVAGYNLIEMLTNGKNPSDGYFVGQVSSFAIDSYNYLPGTQEAYAVELAKKALAGASTGNDPLIDMYIMGSQPLAAYYDPNAQEGTDLYYVKQAMETLFIPYFSRIQGYTGVFYSGISYNNPWSNAQVYIMLGMADADIFQETFIKNGFSMLDSLAPVSQSFGADQGQIARGYEAVVRAYHNENQLFDCTDVVNSTVVANNTIAALPAVDTITDDTTKAAAQEKLTAVDTLLSTLTLTDTQKNSIDKTKYDAVKAKLATSTPGDADKAAAKTVTDQITALPTTDKLTITDKTAVVAARAAYVALTAAQQKLVSNLTILSEAETKIAELEAATGSDEDKAAAKTVIDLITALPTADELALTDKTAVTAARTAYTDLSEAQQKLVTNLTTLVAAEEKIAALESAGSEADQAAAKKVSELIAGIKAADQLKAGDKAELMKIRRAYQALTETQKGLINADVLQKLTDAEAKITELEKTVLPVKSDLDGIEVTGLPEAVKKLKVEDKKADSSVIAAAKKAAEEAGMSNVEVITLYGITPDMSVEELNQFNSDTEKYVTMTLEIPEDKRGAKSYRVYHQKSDNSSEWIDPVVSEDGIYLIFRVDSFSNFGIVAEMKAASETEDEKAAKAVTEQIIALPATGSLDLSDKSKVTDARVAYTALSEAGQKLVTNLSTLTAAEAKIAELEKAAASEADKAAAKKVTDQITALPAASSLALTDKSKVTDARAVYTDLTDVQKALVKNLATLTAAETKITELEKTETDKAAAKKVTDQIAALGTITKWEQKASIDSARSAYNQLSVVQKGLINADSLNTLKAAEAAVEKFKPTAGTITIDVERFTIGQGFYVEPVTLSIKEGETAYEAIKELMGSDNLIGESNYLRAIKGADTGTAAIPDYIVSKLGGGNSTTANAYSQKYSGTTLGEFDYSKYSGWMYLVNNTTPSVGLADYTLKNGDVMRLAFTYWGYGTDLTGIEFGTNKTLVAIANKDSLLKAIAAVNANKTAYLSDETIKSAYNTAMSVVQDMTATQKATNDAAIALNKAVADSSGTDKAAAKTVVDKITALPVVGKLVLTDKAAVTAARIAYDALTTTQKALVTNLETLTAAEAKIAELEKEAANTVNKAAAKAVSDKIAGLHSGTALLLGEKADVLAARIAYDALTDTQKDLVTNLSTLVAAEARIAELEKETPVAKDEKTGIEAVGLPAGTGIKVGDESKDTAKTGEAVKAAEKKGIKNAKVVSLYDIKPDLSDADLEKFNNDKTSYVTLTLPLSGDQQGYDSYMVYHKKSDGTIEWITPTQSADKKSLIFKVNAFSEFGVVGTKASGDTDTSSVNCTYQTQIENVGWQTEKSNGATSGTEGQSLRLEGIKINVAATGKDLGVEYQTHVQNIGWQGFKSNGTLSGTEGKSLRLEGIQIRLTGKDADRYDIYYRVHAQNYGWLDWAKNGENAGTEGFGYRLEGIEIKVVEKNATAPGETDQPFITGNIHINYQTQIQNVGWQELKKDGTISGTSGQSLRLEGIKINVENTGYDVGVSYQTHVENIGWQDLRTNGKMSGTEGESKRLEGIKISLTGNDADLCDVYYQVHAQNTGWMNWAKNGESAGTEGFGYRLEGIRIMVVPKGSPAPSTEAGTVETAFLSNN